MSRQLLIGLPLLLAACGGDGGPTGAGSPEIVGSFIYQEALQGPGGTPACVGGGTLSIARAGNGHTGTVSSSGSCSTASSTSAYTHTGAVTEIRVESTSSGHQVSFRTPSCRFDGYVFARTQTTQMTGAMVCSSGVGGASGALTGGWEAEL